MQIEITDEQIEAMLEKVIRDRVKSYMGEVKLEPIVREVVQNETQKAYYELDRDYIQNTAKEMMTETLQKAICDRITSDIVTALCDRYY